MAPSTKMRTFTAQRKTAKITSKNQRDLILNTKKILQLHDQRPTNRRIIIKRRNIHDHQP